MGDQHTSAGRRKKAMIIGGGVAGPVAAMALQRAGIDSVIHEAHRGGAESAGAFLTFASNGLDALRAIDAEHLVRGMGFPTPRMSFQSGTGKRLGEVPNGGTLPGSPISHTLKRADLYRTLRDEAIQRGVRVEYGKRLLDAETTADGGVTARFEGGTQTTGDLVIGADGIHSRTRRIIDPKAPEARYIPILNISGYASGVKVPDEPDTFRMIFGKRAFFGYAVHPSGEIWWFANPPYATEPDRSELAATTTGQWKKLLIDLFSGDRTPASEIIRATSGQISGWATHDLPSVPTWHRGPMIIIGDAAHATAPSSGQGASMAIEDAVVLARCLRDIPDIGQAFEVYEQLRRGRVERIVAAGARTSESKAAGPIARVVRDLMMPVFLKRAASGGDRSMAWMHDYRIDWGEKVA